MNSTPRVKAVANIAKNRLYVSCWGNIDAKAMNTLYTEIRFCVADLKPRFEVIKDLSQCNIIYINSLPIYKKIIDYLIANNVGEVVRILRNEQVSFRQMLNFSEKIQSYKTVYAESKEEAEQKLEQLTKRDGVRFKLNNLSLEYETDSQIGRGSILDISVSGCAFASSTLPLSSGSECILMIDFEHHDTLVSMFRVKAKVVRAGKDKVAAQFLDIEEAVKEQLYRRLAFEISRTSCFP